MENWTEGVTFCPFVACALTSATQIVAADGKKDGEINSRGICEGTAGLNRNEVEHLSHEFDGCFCCKNSSKETSQSARPLVLQD